MPGKSPTSSRNIWPACSANTRQSRPPTDRSPYLSKKGPRLPPRAFFISALDAVSAARNADHGRHDEQDDGDKEDRLGEFNGHARNAAETENAGDQGDDEKGDDPAQHDKLRLIRFGVARETSTRSLNQSRLGTKVPAALGREDGQKSCRKRNKWRGVFEAG